MGTTVAPIEPSEGMETVKNGVITAGFIFFALALLSTAILGRWFCGWGCHVLLLQDASGKLLNKFGLKPKPFRSRLLMFIPLILGLYMFVWPLVYRFIVLPIVGTEVQWPGFTTHLITTDFWATFPGWMVAIPFLFICSFAIVYFLGMKGYCTYGCPYGGFFAPLDSVATGRIRVTDACEHCGHCTAVCTSNVRVHEEVSDFGMVVDPGCMKCMDCVSVCPNDALYFGFGKPAATTSKSNQTHKRKWDLTWGEEISFAILALVVFLSVYQAYSLISLLFASGLTAIIVFLAYKAWRVLRSRDVRVHSWQLKRAGKLQGLGVIYLAGVALMLVLAAHTGVVRAAIFMGEIHDNRVTTPAHVVFAPDPVIPEEEIIENARKARSWFELGSFVGDGGIGLAWTQQPAIDNRIAWLLAVENRREAAEAHMRESIDRYGLSPQKAAGLARLLRAQEKYDDANAVYIQGIEASPEAFELLNEYTMALELDGKQWEAITFLRERLAQAPEPTVEWLERLSPSNEIVEQMRVISEDQPNLVNEIRRAAILLIKHGQNDYEVAVGVNMMERTLDLEPENTLAYRGLTLGYARQERFEEAEQSLRKSILLEPNVPILRQQLIDLLMGMGKTEEALKVERGEAP